MLVLNLTTDKIQIFLGGTVSTNQLKAVSSWRDRTSTTFIAGRTTISSNNITSVDVVPSPTASNTQRLVDYISIFNTDTATQTVNINLNDNGTLYPLLVCTLLANEKIEFVEGAGWIYYSATGSVKGNQTAAGSTTQIQYNNNGVLAGDTSLTYQGTLNLNGTDTGIKLQAITNEPGAQASGILEVYAKTISGKVMIKQVGPSGLDTPLQNAIWQNNTILFTPGAAAGLWTGTVGANLGTAAIVLPTLTNVGTALRRSTFSSVVTTLNQQVGTRSENIFYRSNVAGLGGFFFSARFMFSSWTTGNRLFVGLSAGTTAVVTVEPSSLTNIAGFSVDSTDTAIFFVHNDGASTATKETIAVQPALATNNAYAAYIFCRPNDNNIYYRLDNLSNNTILIDTFTNTDLPVNTTALCAQVIMGNAANIVVANAGIGINRVYIETDI